MQKSEEQIAMKWGQLWAQQYVVTKYRPRKRNLFKKLDDGKLKQPLCEEMFLTKGAWWREDNFEYNNV
jgi:hypothetical protein